MFSPKNLDPLQVFSLKSSSSSSSSSSAISSMKFKNLIHTLIVSHMCRVIRALSKVKDVILQILKESHSNIHKKHCSRTKKIIYGSFRLHYNWCSSKSSHVLPVPTRIFQGLPSSSCEQQQGGEDCPDSQLAGYLQWLEEKVHDDEEINEIDMLAEMFIANCHEKFKLEKQESDRRFQEMLARSM